MMREERRRKRARARRLLIAGLALLAVAGLLASASGVQAATGPGLVADLDEDGDATLTLVATYDLDDDQEREAFETLREDEESRQAMADRFAERMATVADEASASTGRELTVSDASADLSVEDDTGVARFEVTVSNLAAADGDRLVVSEPFASGAALDRPLTVLAPEGYEVVGATPEPDEVEGGAATWSADADLDGFEATFAPADEETAADGGEESGDDGADAETDDGGGDGTGDDDDAAADSVPGFGVGAALVALGIALARSVRRS